MSSPLIENFHTLRITKGHYLGFTILSTNGSEILNGAIGQTFPITNKTKIINDGNKFEVDFTNLGQLTIVHSSSKKGQHKYKFEWTSNKPKLLIDTFDLTGSHWYGGCQIRKQTWPIENWNMRLSPYLASDSFNTGEYGGVQERYFLSSHGIAIFIEEDVPLFISINNSNDKKLSLVSKFESPYKNIKSQKLFLAYSIFQDIHLRNVHEFARSHVFLKPINIPNELMFRYSIWSTWAFYKKKINQKLILEFADNIIKHGFKASQLEIDDDWTSHYGDLDFDKSKFSNPKEMIQEIKKKNIRVTLWVHPFASSLSDVRNRTELWLSTFTGGYTHWWNGIAKCLDVTNPIACEWFKENLQKLKIDYDIDSYKFDAGETNWLPDNFKSFEPINSPNQYTKSYAELCYSIDTELRAQEVRVGMRTQNLPIFVRMMEKQSNWNFENGIITIIPQAITFGIIGYPFVLADMVGGNAYGGFPEKELYIRWIEVNALLPSIQISIPPWHYDEQVISISKKMLELHEMYANYIIDLAKQAKEDGSPIIRPMWWLAPNDEIAQTIDSQFMLGNDVLVAPILEKGSRTRSVYIAEGRWKCQNSGRILEENKWHDNCTGDIDELPYFRRI